MFGERTIEALKKVFAKFMHYQASGLRRRVLKICKKMGLRTLGKPINKEFSAGERSRHYRRPSVKTHKYDSPFCVIITAIVPFRIIVKLNTFLSSSGLVGFNFLSTQKDVLI